MTIFNGKNFENFTTADGLTNDTIYTIFKYDDTYLIGTRTGISIFANNKFYQNSLFTSLSKYKIYSFAINEDNNLYVGTNNGLFIIKENNVEQIKKDFFIYSLLYSSNGTLWCGTNKGVYTFTDGEFKLLKQTKNHRVNSVIADKSGNIWFAIQGGIAKLDDKNNYIFYSANDSEIGHTPYAIFIDKEDNIWIGTNHGLHIFDDGLFALYNRRKGVKVSVWCFYENDEGEIWVGTDGNGILKLENGKFKEIEQFKNLPKTIWNIFEDNKHNIWFATNKGAVKYSKNGRIKYYNKNSGFTDDMVIDIYEDSKKNLWFTTFKSGVYKYKDEKFSRFNLKNAGTSPIFRITENLDGSLIILSSAGIDIIKNNKHIISHLAKNLSNYSFYSISIDSVNNKLLLGTYNRGLLIYDMDKDSSTFIFKNEGLNDASVVFDVFSPDKSYLWIGTNKGLNRLDYRYFIKTGKVKLKSYNKYDGFPGTECNQTKCLWDSKGNFWFSTVDGIVTYNPQKEKKETSIPQPIISSIEINYQKVNLSEYGEIDKQDSLSIKNIEFPHFMNNITIYYSALYFTNPLDVKFSYRLIGSNDKFSPLTKNEYVTFSSLPPGSYTFELISYTNEGNKPSKPIYFSFLITTPFWQSGYFYILIVFLGFLLIYIAHRIRTNAIRKKNDELFKLYQENIAFQQKLIESEKDYKGLFENAHDPILVINPETHLIVDANNSAENLYGYSKDELVNMSLKVLSTNPNCSNDFIDKVIENKNVRRYHLAHLKKDGSEIILSANATVTNYQSKLAIVSIQRDITEEEETKKMLLLAKEAAEKSNKLKSEFLAQISHEIRTPINTILGFVNLIIEECKEQDIQLVDEYYVPIKRSSERIIRTIDLILNMSEINAGTFDLTIKEIDIAELIYEIVVEQRQRAKAKSLDLVLTNNAKNTLLFIDEYTFGQIFVNLIDNAIKYTNSGKIAVTIFNEQDKTVIEVADTGIGIAEEYLTKIFDAFTQEEQGYTRKYEGNGLGLALVKNYVMINKGNIFVKSKKGKGSTFRVEF